MIKVNIISGFLGSGKTTFIKRLIKAYKGEKIAILENEFGEIGIDGDIIRGDGYEVVELASGCICCSMKLDFEDAIVRIASDMKPERIIIEPTGIGLLSEIKGILSKPKFDGILTLQGAATIVDAVDFEEQLEVFGEFFTDQIANADAVVLSKVQQSDIAMARKCAQKIKEFNLLAPVVEDDWDCLSENDARLIAEGRFGRVFGKMFQVFPQESASHCDCGHEAYDETGGCSCSMHGGDSKRGGRLSTDGFASISIFPTAPCCETELTRKLEIMKAGGLGEVVRGKGLISSGSGMIEFSYVNGRYEMLGCRYQCSPETARLCIIGRGLDEEKIRNLFK